MIIYMAKLRSILLVIIMCCWCYDDGFAETVIVSKDGRGDYTSIREAINKAPRFVGGKKRHRIYVAAGVYEEYIIIPREKTNIELIGSGRRNTKIVGYRSASDTTVDQTATLGILFNCIISLINLICPILLIESRNLLIFFLQILFSFAIKFVSINFWHYTRMYVSA